jgi:hypothetical protein
MAQGEGSRLVGDDDLPSLHHYSGIVKTISCSGNYASRSPNCYCPAVSFPAEGCDLTAALRLTSRARLPLLHAKRAARFTFPAGIVRAAWANNPVPDHSPKVEISRYQGDADQKVDTMNNDRAHATSFRQRLKFLCDLAALKVTFVTKSTRGCPE